MDGSGLGADRRSHLFGRRRHSVWHHHLPIAAFLEADGHLAELGFLLHDERRAALRAWLGERHVRRGEIAIRITRAAVEDARAQPPPFSRTAAAYELAFLAFGAFDSHGDGAGVLALRVAGTADEFAEAPVFFDEMVVAQSAFFFQRFIGLMGHARAGDQAPRGLAIRVAGASQKGAKAAAFHGHFFAAVFAILGFGFPAGFLAVLGRKILDKITVRIARAAQEKTVAGDALQQLALAALLALLAGGNAGLVGNHLVVSLRQIDDKFLPKLPHRLAPGQLAFFDFVELFIEARREGDVKDVVEAFHQQDADAFAQHGRREAPLIFLDVFALDDGRNDRSVSGWPADAFFFQVLYQRGFRIARRWLGKVLVGPNLVEPENLALFDARQILALAFVVFLVVFAVRDRHRSLVDPEIAIELLHRAGGAESVVASGDVDRGLIQNGRKHLRSHEALPNQLVQLEKIVVQVFANVFRRARDVRRPHRLVRFLRILLGFVVVRLFRNIVRAKALRDQLADLCQGIVRDVHGIRAHVGDQRDRAFLAEVHAFIQALGDPHGALRGVAQPVVRGLLQLRCRERRRRMALLFPLGDRSHLPLGLAHRGDDLVRRFLVRDFDVFPFVLAQLGFEDRRLAAIEHGVNGPVLLRKESPNLQLAFDDQAERPGLYAPRRKPAADLVPKQRRNLVTHDAVKNPPGLLRIHQVGIHLAGLFKGGANGLGRDLVEGYPENLLRIDRRNADFVLILLSRLGLRRFAFLAGFAILAVLAVGHLFFREFCRLGQNHRQMCRNGFPFAVGVTRQVDGGGRKWGHPQIID